MTSDLIPTLEAAVDLLRRARTYIGNPTDHPAMRQSPRNDLVNDIDAFLEQQEVEHG